MRIDANSEFAKRLIKQITAAQTTRVDVVTGSAIVSLKDASAIAVQYAHNVGYLHGMADVLRMCENVYDELNKGDV